MGRLAGRPVGRPDGEAGNRTSYSPVGAGTGAELGKKKFVDGPRKGVRTLESNRIYSGSRILLRKESYQDENDINNSDTDDASVLVGKVNTLVDPQGSEIMREGEFYAVLYRP